TRADLRDVQSPAQPERVRRVGHRPGPLQEDRRARGREDRRTGGSVGPGELLLVRLSHRSTHRIALGPRGIPSGSPGDRATARRDLASEQELMEGQNGSAGSEEGPFHYLDALPVGIFIALPGGRPYYANREAVRLLGRGVLTSTTGPQLATAYQAYVIGTDEIYPTERSPLIRALAGEISYIDDIEIRRP